MMGVYMMGAVCRVAKPLILTSNCFCVCLHVMMKVVQYLPPKGQAIEGHYVE